MKSKNFLSNLWSLLVGSQRNDVEVDRRLTVGLPSGFTINWTLKLVSVLAILLTVGVGDALGAIASGTYVLCTSTSDLEANAHYIIASGTSSTVYCISNVSNTNNRKTVSASVSSNKITVAANSTIMTFTLGGNSTNGWTFSTDNYAGTAGMLAAASSNSNYLKVIASPGNDGKWNITFSSNVAKPVAKGTYSRKYMKYNYNQGTPIFACYGSSGSESLYLYKLTATCAPITPTLSYTSTNLTIGGGNSSSPTLNKDGSSGAVTWSSDDEDVATVNSSGVVTPVGTGTCNITASIAAAGGKCAGEVSVEFTITRTITYYVGSTSYTVGGIDGATLLSVLPASPSSCDDDNYPYFYGWKNGSISGSTTTPPTILSTETVSSSSAANTYYAVFTDALNYSDIHTSNVNISSNATAVIGGSNYDAKKLGSNGSGGSFTITVPSGTTKLYLHAAGWNNKSSSLTLSTSVGSISPNTAQNLTSNSGVANSTPFTLATPITNAFFEYTLSNINSAATITITANNERALVWGVNSATSAGGSGNYITTCCTPLGSINGAVNWSNGTRATLSWDDIANVASWAVTAIDNTTSSAVAAGNITTPNDDGDTYSCVVSNLTAGHNYTFTIAATAESGYCDKSQEITATAPNITTSASSITGLEYIDGNGPSEAKSFTVSAAGLTGNLTVAAPTNFQVSTTSSTSGFGNSATLTPVSGSLTNATVWVRLTAGLSENTYGSASTYVTISGGGAANKNVSVQGLVSAACTAPTITAQPSGATYNLNTPATALSVTATGESLTYQWYSNTANNNTSGTIISGATNSTYTPATTTKGTIYYYCVVSSGACHTASNTATITVRTPSIATASPSVIAFGDKKVGGTYTATFTISATNLAYNTGLTLTLGGTARAYYSIDKTSIAQTSAGTVASTTVTVTYNPTAAGVHGAGANTYVTISSEGATSTSVTLSGTGKWEVTWKASGSDDQTTLVGNGERPTFPSAPSSCDGTSTTFIGWTKTAWTGKQTKTYVDGLTTDATKVHTSNSTMSTVTANGTTYHAVWAEGDIYWGRMTSSDLSSLAAGSKLVIVAVAQGYVLKNDLTNSNSVPSETAGVISPSSDLIWELAGSSGAWNIKSGSNTIGTQYNSCAGAGNGVVLLANNNHQSYSIGSSSHGTNEFYIKDNACDNGVLTKVSKYDDFRIVNVSSYSSAADAALKLYTQKGSYSNFMTTCCDKLVTLADAVKSGTGSGTVTFSETSPVATCAGTTTVTATVTPNPGHRCDAISFSGGDVSVTIPDPFVPFTGATNYTLTFAQNTNATLETTVTFTQLQDKYYDYMHGNTTTTKSGNYGAAPSLSSEEKGDGCTGSHYKFIGWIPESDMNMETGEPTTTANMVAGGATGKYATGTNYYAIWAEEVEP